MFVIDHRREPGVAQ